MYRALGGSAPRGAVDLRVDAGQCPGWVRASERLPAAGERVYTNEGTAVVTRILGRTGSGRLLELAMDDGRRVPFFAAAANVMVPPHGGTDVLHDEEGGP